MKNKVSLYGNKKVRRNSIIVASVLLALVIAVNVALSIVMQNFGAIINSFLAGDNIDASEAASVYEYADSVVRDAAAESMVLLENKDGYLPQKDLTKVNLFGWGSTEYGFLLTGGGSGGTSITDDKDVKIDLNDAFKSEGIEYNQQLYDAYTAFSNYDADYRSGGSTGANVVPSLKNPEADFYSESLMNSAKQYSPVAVAVLSRWGAENGGEGELKNIGSFTNGTFLELTSQEKAMFDALENYGFEVIVVLNVCNNMELGFIKDYSSIKACIFAGIPGQSGAVAIPQIITGKVNPSGKTSDIFPYDYQTNNPTYANTAKSGGSLVYQEGIYFGYKWYETADKEGFFAAVDNKYGKGYDGVVQYPFGYGLSYTTFERTAVFADDASLNGTKTYEVQVTVKNTGNVAGRDVVEIYGHSDYKAGGIEKPERVLLDFAKTKLLQPGEEEKLTLKFTAYDLASYDAYDKNNNGFKGYELEKGNASVGLYKDSHTKESERVYQVLSDIKFDKDPVTGNPIENLFTGSNAYANCPIDGSTVYVSDPVEYLSRKDKFTNYSKIKQFGTPSNTSAVSAANTYRYTGYNTEEIKQIVATYAYGDSKIFNLVMAAFGEGENQVLKEPDLAQLNGNASDCTLVPDKTILELFQDYDAEETAELWNLLLNQLTENEIKDMLGKGGFQTIALESIGKPRCEDKDGPAGFNNNVKNPGKSSEFTLYPSESLLGCSWSREINYKIGEAQGKIGSACGISGWYAPGVNLHRSVYNSRNYEYYSEDGVLSGYLAAETVKGTKDNNVYCYVKHFAVSEAGQNPNNLNTWLTEQALRESYLKPFEIAVKNGKATGIMSAFNRVGGVLSGYNHALLTDILRTEWGFRGTVITDWFGGANKPDVNIYMSDFEAGILAGNDLWLAGTAGNAANIDLSKPEVAYAARRSAKNIIYTFIHNTLDSEGIKVNPPKKSPIIPIVWVAINLLFAGGIALCVLKIVKTYKKQKVTEE